ncbi:aspartate/glutamate racemase family protein [Nocardioides sp. InS609-2]|uniref:aspartate/glutamate racemase family protein n=1 Tax=Nocardioides sp. InS609-2 TaxID=2760705 RepID=UPI0020BF36EB|nr:aspartate/glutamate racemase family protein [Nocardioides sp. InS609-2]
MQTIGLIGGMSWHSTASYYRIINEAVAAHHGGHASARIAMQSLDFAEVRACQLDGDWDRAAALLTDAAKACVAGGADVVAICTNLMHKVAPQVEAGAGVPLLHIADAVAGVAAPHGWDRLGILGARWVMEETFYADRLAGHGITALSPDAADRDLVDRVVFDELTQGRIEDSSRAAYIEVIERLAERGAQAVVLACTEIGLLVSAEDSPLPLIDSAEAHATALAEFALAPAYA